MKRRPRQSLPVIMHHSVSEDRTRIGVRPAVFEAQCRDLAENGWFGLGLDQAEEFLLHGAPVPEKSFLMTFDDGFLDNYVYAWPIMRKYGHKGVIFAVTDRIDQAHQDWTSRRPGGRLFRPTLEDVWQGRCAQGDLPDVDAPLRVDDLGHTVREDLFFTWDEARLMEKSGILAVAAHSARHEQVFTGPAWSGFEQPEDQAITFCHTVSPSVWGMPRFARKPELACRAFIPSPALVEAIAGLVPQNLSGMAGARDFFNDPAKVDKLKALVARHKDKLGDYESEDDRKLRLRAVMDKCRDALARELGHGVRSFCWPWGVGCEEAREQGLAAGFEVFYTTVPGVNLPGAPLAVHRVKVKNRTDSWLINRLRIYSRPRLGGLYVKLRVGSARSLIPLSRRGNWSKKF